MNHGDFSFLRQPYEGSDFHTCHKDVWSRRQVPHPSLPEPRSILGKSVMNHCLHFEISALTLNDTQTGAGNVACVFVFMSPTLSEPQLNSVEAENATLASC